LDAPAQINLDSSIVDLHIGTISYRKECRGECLLLPQMVGIASAAIYSILTPISNDTGLTLGDLVGAVYLDSTWSILIVSVECWDWIYVPVLWLGLLGMAAFGPPIWKAPSVSLQPLGDNGKSNALVLLVITRIQSITVYNDLGTIHKEQRHLDRK
jgi:hypothetical protein